MTATDPALRPTALEVAQAAAGLPTHMRPERCISEPDVTQPSFLSSRRSCSADSARCRSHPPAAAVPRTRRRRGVRTGAVALTASLSTAVVLGITASVWPTAVDAATDPPGSGVIVEPLSMDSEQRDTAVEPAADTVAERRTSGRRRCARPVGTASDVETKRADEARKAAESAQREAERAQRDAEKQQRQNERESPSAQRRLTGGSSIRATRGRAGQIPMARISFR